jgi:membrane protease YdiL (CAAX protease family)
MGHPSFVLLFQFHASAGGNNGKSTQPPLQVQFPLWNQWIRHPASEGVFLLLSQGLLDVLIFLFIYLTITLKYNAPFFPSIHWIKLEKKAIGLFGAAGAALAMFVLALSSLLPETGKPPIEELLKFPATMVLYSTLGILVAPFVEEVLFRGFIYPVLERVAAKLLGFYQTSGGTKGGFPVEGGKILAVIVTAILFVLLHVGQLWGSLQGILLILLVGLTLSTVRAVTGSIKPGFIIHLAYNSTICLLVFLGVLVQGFPK